MWQCNLLLTFLGNTLLLSDILGTEPDVVCRGLDERDEVRSLRRALAALPEREREIITLRYGIGRKRELTQKEVADRLGISQSYISRLEKRILKQLKKEMSKKT